MTTSSLFIRFPAFPFGYQDLMPDAQLARLAGALVARGHVAEILDYGTAAALDRVYPHECRDSLLALLDETDGSRSANPLSSLVSVWRTRAARRSFQSRAELFSQEIARHVASRKHLDIVVFKIDSPRHWEAVAPLANAIRAVRPSVTLAGVGGFDESVQRAGLGAFGPLDVLLLSDLGAAMVALAEGHGDRAKWATAPDLLYRMNGVTLRSSRSESCAALDALSDYTSDVYPALTRGEKPLVLPIEGAKLPLSDDRLGVSVAGELERLHKVLGTKAFHIHAPEMAPAQLRAFLRELRARRLRPAYSAHSSIENVDAITLAAMKSTGCYSIGFETPSGSYRLLKDYYGKPFGVTQAEQALRAAKAAGLYTVTHLTYPCPHDDYHTEAETVRLMDRTRPHSAPIHTSAAARGEWWPEGSGGALRPLGRRPRRQGQPMVACASGTDWGRDHGATASALAAEIERRGVSTEVTEGIALLASLSGYAQREDEFCRVLRRQLFTGDITGVAAWVASINQAACDPINTSTAAPWEAIQAAVGN